VDQESHDQTEPPASPCPWWCADRDYAGTADHPDRHTGHSLSVDAERPDGFPTVLHALLMLPLNGRVIRALITDADADLATLSAPCSRSLAAALTRLADVAEGVVSL
jgi:hypothetical protein